jgi:hypothetical protein
MPEIVVFGHEQRVKPPAGGLFAGKQIMVVGLENGDLKLGRFTPGEETVYQTCPPLLDSLIRSLVKLGAGYAEVIQCLQEAQQAGCLDSRLAVEAVPRPDRKYYKSDDPLPEAPAEEEGSQESVARGQESGVRSQESEAGVEGEAEPLAARRAATPAPEFFQDGIDARAAANENQPRPNAANGDTYINPDYRPQNRGFFDRLNPFAKKGG